MKAGLRTFTAALALVALGACTGGVDAGERGGIAFIVMAGMLLGICLILWLVLGRGE